VTGRPLPGFNERPGYVKTQPLDNPYAYQIEDAMRGFLEAACRRARPDRRPLRVLDVGCGRGEMVAQLLHDGWSAWGCDAVEAYINRGVAYLTRAGLPTDRLRMCTPTQLPFDTGTFDVVVSNQVLEHVTDLGALAGELARVSAPHARGLHVFPGRRILTEPHLGIPLVHWLRPGSGRTALTRLAIRAGWSVNYFNEMTVADRARIYLRYLDEQTSYRSAVNVQQMLESAGLPTSLEYRASEEALARNVQ
jgi:SAM-dependent methyltransferase